MKPLTVDKKTVVIAGRADQFWCAEERQGDCELWCINDNRLHADKWFHLHSLEHIYQQNPWSGLEQLAADSNGPGTLFMYERDVLLWDEFCTYARRPSLVGKLKAEAIDLSILDPRGQDLLDDRRFLTGSFAITLAMLAYMRTPPSTVILSRVDFRYRIGFLSEAWATDAIHFYVGVLAGRGVRTKIYGAGLFEGREKVYGWDGPGGHTDEAAEQVRAAMGMSEVTRIET